MDHEGRTCLSYAKAALSLASNESTNLERETPSAPYKLNSLGKRKRRPYFEFEFRHTFDHD